MGSHEPGDSPDLFPALRNNPSCSLALSQSLELRGLPCGGHGSETPGPIPRMQAGAGETPHLATLVHVTMVMPASWDSLSEDSPLGT